MAKILLIDDSEDVRNLVVQVLGKDYEIYAVEDWASANPYIFQKEVDLILIDVNMPGVKGDQIAQVLIETSLTKKFKIVLFSSMDLGELRKKAKEAGVTGYIQKTLDGQHLLEQVGKYIA